MTQTGFIEVNGDKLYYEVTGTGYPLVLIHAGIANSQMWDIQFKAFAERYRMIRYDLRGFGKSDVATSEFTMRGDLYTLLRSLEIEKAYLVGVSIGGSIAIDFTLEHPEMVAALIPVGSGLSGYTKPSPDVEQLNLEARSAYEAGDLSRTVDIALQIWAAGPTRSLDQVNPLVREQIREMMAHTFAKPEGEHSQSLTPPAIDRLHEISVPTLVIVGDKDVNSILEISDLLTQGIPGAQKVVIPNTAHMPNMEKPTEFNKIVLEFLEKT